MPFGACVLGLTALFLVGLAPIFQYSYSVGGSIATQSYLILRLFEAWLAVCSPRQESVNSMLRLRFGELGCSQYPLRLADRYPAPLRSRVVL